MKANLKKFFALAALGMTLLINAAPVPAGYQYKPQVGIFNDNGYLWASGSMVGARYSADTKQNIGAPQPTLIRLIRGPHVLLRTAQAILWSVGVVIRGGPLWSRE